MTDSKKLDKKPIYESSLVNCDFSKLEERVLAWMDWHEGPVHDVKPLKFEGTATGRWKAPPEPQYLVGTGKSGVVSAPIEQGNEEQE